MSSSCHPKYSAHHATPLLTPKNRLPRTWRWALCTPGSGRFTLGSTPCPHKSGCEVDCCSDEAVRAMLVEGGATLVMADCSVRRMCVCGGEECGDVCGRIEAGVRVRTLFFCWLRAAPLIVAEYITPGGGDGWRRSPAAVRHLSFAVDHSAFVVCHLPFAIRPSWIAAV
eukprot:358688-Chlamydomonas_euryale.AAC.5